MSEATKTVFLVTVGCYSDYRVNSVWTTRGGAEERAKTISRDDDPSVEEYVLNPQEETDCSFWNVVFDRNGARAEKVVGAVSESKMFVGADDERGSSKHGDGNFFVRGSDVGEAIKIAAERRASMLAAYAGESEKRGRWVSDET